MRWVPTSRTSGSWVPMTGVSLVGSGNGKSGSFCSRRRPFSALLYAFILVAALSMIYLGYEVVRLPLENGSGHHLLVESKGVRMAASWDPALSKQLDSAFFRNEEPLGAIRVNTPVPFDRLNGGGGDDDSVQDRQVVTDLWQSARRRSFISAVRSPSSSSSFRSTWPSASRDDLTHVNLSAYECSLTEAAVARATIRMADVYDDLDVANVDGGVWKQGFPLVNNETMWRANNTLRVFLVPHSHNDPGWLKTFEKYYLDQTQHILNNVVIKMAEDKRHKFIWAETSFLALWWERTEREKRQAFRNLLANGQVEIVTGGWVMTDEAVVHYYAMLEQLIEGHEWLQNHLGYYPRNGWSIDPFGMSPTMAYLLKRMGLGHMVVQRVHYSVKKRLARDQSLEFLWRQAWDHENTTDILCHMMPFYSYDVPHTCGPDPKVCCQFDFKRLPGGKVGCPWKVPPQPITPENVEAKAWLLLDQYRKKSQLFRTNVLLVPLGDDFRFDKAIEWDQQFKNYHLLFDYMNGRRDWHVQAQFGTLDDYFSALVTASHETVSREGGEPGRASPGLEPFPSLVGDFFTYSDRDDHYWSGFYSSRPFYKHMDRALESYLRSAEIGYSTVMARSLASAAPDGTAHASYFLGRSFTSLVEARRNLGLFQHHDAITGTSKDPVVVDYGKKLLDSLRGVQQVLAKSASHVLTDTTSSEAAPPLVFDVDDARASHSSLPSRTPITLSRDDDGGFGRIVTFYNSMGYSRTEMVAVLVDVSRFVDARPRPCVLDHDGIAIQLQMNPVWHGPDIVDGQAELVFMVRVPTLGFVSYRLVGELDGCNGADMASVLVHPEYDLPVMGDRNGSLRWSVGHSDLNSEFTLRGLHVEATFSSDGLLTSMSSVRGGNGAKSSAVTDDVGSSPAASLDVGIEFVTYGTRRGPGKDKSGAYLFLPDGDAVPIPVPGHGWYYRVVRGVLASEVHLLLPSVEHRVIVRSPSSSTASTVDSFGVEVRNIVDLRSGKKNVEVAMRLVTGIRNADGHFYTDLNGFQMVRRHHRSDLPMQANFYPLSSVAYIDDDEARFTVATAQPSSVAALKPGWLEFVLDRRLAQDDNRGLQQGVLDNVPTLSQFMFLFEKRVEAARRPLDPKTAISLPTLAVMRVSHALLYPITTLIARRPEERSDGPSPPPMSASSTPAPFSLTDAEFPCDMQVVNLRVSTAESDDGRVEPQESTLLVLHRFGFDCGFYMPSLDCQLSSGKLSLGRVFVRFFADKVTQTSLSSLYKLKTFSKRNVIDLQPMELYAFRLHFR